MPYSFSLLLLITCLGRCGLTRTLPEYGNLQPD